MAPSCNSGGIRSLFNDDSSNSDSQSKETPLPPTELTADVSVLYEITLSWKDNANNEKGYALGSIQLPANTIHWTLTDLEKPSYKFELFAYNDAGISSSVWSEEIRVTWEYPHIYKIINIDVEGSTTNDEQTPNGFLCVYEDSITVSYTCIVDGEEIMVTRTDLLTLTSDQVWGTTYFSSGNEPPKKSSIWAIKVDSMESIDN